MRLFLIYYLTTDVASAEMDEMEKALTNVASANGLTPDLSPWHYLRSNPSFQRHASLGESLTSNATTVLSPKHHPSMGMFKGLAGNLAGHAQGFLQQAAASVKNFLPENKKLHITRVTDAICELKPNTEDDSFLYLDPKMAHAQHAGSATRHRSAFREAIVFIIGGGNYHEYQNLQTYAKGQNPPRNVIYGCTELLRPEALLAQLSATHRATR